MIGIDITNISRFKEKNIDFAKRILSDEEIKEYESTPLDLKPIFLAKRWAIKEAIFKADNSFFEFNKITLINKYNKLSFLNFEISVSHDNDVLVAVVLKNERNNNECKN